MKSPTTSKFRRKQTKKGSGRIGASEENGSSSRRATRQAKETAQTSHRNRPGADSQPSDKRARLKEWLAEGFSTFLAVSTSYRVATKILDPKCWVADVHLTEKEIEEAVFKGFFSRIQSLESHDLKKMIKEQLLFQQLLAFFWGYKATTQLTPEATKVLSDACVAACGEFRKLSIAYANYCPPKG